MFMSALIIILHNILNCLGQCPIIKPIAISVSAMKHLVIFRLSKIKTIYGLTLVHIRFCAQISYIIVLVFRRSWILELRVRNYRSTNSSTKE